MTTKKTFFLCFEGPAQCILLTGLDALYGFLVLLAFEELEDSKTYQQYLCM